MKEKLKSVNVPKTKKVNPGKIGVFRMFAWQTRLISTGSIIMILGFLSIYCTDTLGMSPALVGTLLMLSKITDAIVTPFIGYIIDKTNSKLGRGRPYELCIIGLWLCTILMFSCPPQFSMLLKGVWVFMMYTMVMTVFETFLTANGPVYMARAFKNHEQHVALQTYGSIIVMFGIALFNITFPMIMNRLATSPKGWTTLMLIFGIPLCAIGFLRFIFIKEITDSEVKAAEEKVNFKELIVVLRSNKYIWLIAIWFFSYNVVTNFAGTVGQYYYLHIMKNMDLFGVSQIGTILILPIFFAMPTLLRRISLGKVIVIGLLICALGNLIYFVAYTNFPLLMIGSILSGVGAVPANMLLPLLIIDNAEYNEYLGNERLEGTMSALTGFTQNVGAAFGTFIIGILLTTSGYIGSAKTISDSALSMIRYSYSLIPMAILVVVAFIMMFYKLDNKMPQIRTENREKREKREAAV